MAGAGCEDVEANGYVEDVEIRLRSSQKVNGEFLRTRHADANVKSILGNEDEIGYLCIACDPPSGWYHLVQNKSPD